jgi:Family of unknown function (DUF6353)
MQVTQIAKKLERILRDNSPAILTALGVSGVVTTTYLTAKASFKAAEIIRHEETFYTKDLVSEVGRKEVLKKIWKCYIPPVISGVASIGCIIAATKVEYRRTAAAQAALSISERAFSEYKEKIIEQFGKNKEQTVRDDIAKDRIRNNPPPSKEILFTGPGVVLCSELYTGRYFTSDMETLRKAQNDINEQLNHHDWASLDDFYYMVKLQRTSMSSSYGWTSDKLMELQFSTVLTEDGRPCLSFEYNYVKPL